MRKIVILAIFLAVSGILFAYPATPRVLSSTSSHYLRSLLHFKDGNYQGAYDELGVVKVLDPYSGYLHLKAAFLLLKLGKDAEAEKEFKKAKELSPDNLDISIALIFFYASKEMGKELESEYQYFLEKVHQLRPQNVRISEYLGQFYFYKKMHKEAIKVYQAIIKQKPDFAEGYFWLGYFYEETGERKKAISMWKKTLTFDIKHADALNSLGYIYAEEGINLDEAEGLVKRALEGDSDNGAYLDSLGWIYFKKEDYKQAEEYLVKALKYLKEPVIYEHLGDLYVKLKDIDKALKSYKEGLVLDPEDDSLKRKIVEYEKKDSTVTKESE